jgi:hypothetical protein
MNKFFYTKSNGDIIEGHIDLTVLFYIEIGQEIKAVTHEKWIKHNNLTMKDNSFFDLENKKMSLRIAKLNYSFDPNNKYYKQELTKAEDDLKKEIDNLKT